MRKSLALLFLFGLLCASIFAVYADEGSDDSAEKDSGDQDDEEMKRRLDIDESDSKVVIRSETEEGKDKSRIDFEFKTDDGELEFRVNYYTSTDDSKSRFQARVEVEQLVEFREVNGQEGYQPGADTAVRTINFDQADESFWDPITCQAVSAGYDCSVSSASGEFAGVVHLVGNVANIDGIPVRPTSLKLDVQIDLQNKAADTYVALIIKSFSKETQSEKSSSDEENEGFATTKEKQVSFGDNGFFSWATTANITGVSTPVDVKNVPLQNADNDDDAEEGEHGHRLVFWFDSTAVGKITWDPKLGVDTSSAFSLVPTSLAFWLIAAFLGFKFF